MSSSKLGNDINICLTNAFRIIFELYNNNSKELCNDIAITIFACYNNNILDLNKDILKIFVNTSRDVKSFIDAYPKEYEILKEIFGTAIIGYYEKN
jgi:hypothetical protein